MRLRHLVIYSGHDYEPRRFHARGIRFAGETPEEAARRLVSELGEVERGDMERLRAIVEHAAGVQLPTGLFWWAEAEPEN